MLDTRSSGWQAADGRARYRLAKRASAYLHDRVGRPVTAMELCARYGASDRLLRLAFKETYGMGPIAYHRLMRMHAVRAALLAARGRDRPVAEILSRFGVIRPAAFAGEYRRQFGELPSHTLGVRGGEGIQAMTRAGAG